MTGGGRSFKEVEPLPESLEVSKYLSSVQRSIKIRGCRSNSEMPSEQNGFSSEKRKSTTLNFDFNSPPKKVTWNLNSFPEAPGSWTPLISGEMVPEHTRQEWDAAFTYHVHGEVASSSKGFQTPTRAVVSGEPSDLVISDDQEKRPDWLPSDWQVEYRRREGGATAGLTDRYYYEPGSHRQFRSKKEVLCYLETGTRRTYKGNSNSGVNVTPSVSTGLSEPNGSSSEKRKRTTLNFDFNSPPKKVTWTLNSFPEAPGSWTPLISGERVPGHTRQEWDAAFAYHVHRVVASSSKVDEVAENLEAGV